MNNSNSSIIKLESLEKEYMLVLSQYEEAYNNYTTTMSSSSPDSSNNFVSLQGNTFWGTSGLKEGSATTQEECESMCLSDQACTGATFNTDKRYCWTRAGDGIVNSGLNTDFALLPKIKQNLNVLKNLNQRLLNINTDINTELDKLYPIAQQETDAKNEKQKQLNNTYAGLLKQQIVLDETFKEYQTIESELDSNIIYVNQQNTLLKFWLLFALILLAIIIKQFLGINGTPGILYFIGALIIIVIITLNYK